MKVKNCNAAVSSLAGMRCDFPTTNFMALGQCNCSNYLHSNDRHVLVVPSLRTHDPTFPWLCPPLGNGYSSPAGSRSAEMFVEGSWRGLGKREMQLNCYCRGIIMHKCLLLSPLSGFLCSVTNLEGIDAS